MKTSSYKDLIVWQKSMSLVFNVYKLTELFPSSEKFGLISQSRRSAVSIPSNIAEGYARQHIREYIHLLSIAYASGAELETQLLITRKLGYGNTQSYEIIFPLLKEVQSILNVMIRKLKEKNCRHSKK